MFCRYCGKEFDDDQLFCPFCGKSVKRAAVKKTETTSPEPQLAAKNTMRAGYKKEKHLKIFSAMLIAACIVVAGAYLLIGFMNGEKTVTSEGVQIIDSFADTKPVYHDEKRNAYKIDYIMLIDNNSAEDIAGAMFQVKDKDGNNVMNALSSESVFKADGLIRHGERGIMTSSIWVNDKEKATSGFSIVFSNAIKYSGEDNYVVPKGIITDVKGLNNDYYTVKINNPNSVEISRAATFVAVRCSGDKIEDADATGRIDENIAVGSGEYEIDGVFQDPEFDNGNKYYGKYDVFAIDSQCYRKGE